MDLNRQTENIQPKTKYAKLSRVSLVELGAGDSQRLPVYLSLQTLTVTTTISGTPLSSPSSLVQSLCYKYLSHNPQAYMLLKKYNLHVVTITWT